MSFLSPQTQQKNIQEILSKSYFTEDMIFYLYSMLKKCLLTTTFEKNDICIVNKPQPYEKKDRFTAICNNTHSTIVTYDAENLILYGGGAYKMHLYYIKKMYNKYGFPLPRGVNIENININDIDMVWWPSVIGPANELFIYKQSDKITDLFIKIKENIEYFFNKTKPQFIKILENNNVIFNKNTVSFNVVKSDDFNRGINVITVSSIINEIPYKLIEIAIHDGASSQDNGMIPEIKSGRLVPFVPLQSMAMDPTYSQVNLNIDYNEYPENHENVKIPMLDTFIIQQIFAYNNLIKMGDLTKSKTTIIMLRLITLKKLLDVLLQIIQQTIFYKTQSQELIVKHEYAHDFNIYMILKNAHSFLLKFLNPLLSQRGGKTQKKGHQLFNDNPRGRPVTKGIGYGTAKKARNSITRLKEKSKTYKKQVATTMYYRAKHHKYQNQGMRNAMKIWKKYMNQLK